ncbi:MAG TPA: DUF5682 family protein [Accumulibacter sp.]|jgi:hypothetical protein|nr:DUF5682 family protein [Accumulibacter sp.]
MPLSPLTILGVRHHSPACARRVRAAIDDLRPAVVLIEGPVDFNPHLDDLRGAHRLPIAIFSFHSDPTHSHASYSPFCDYSPEWQALRGAWARGATPLFCDLPAWHPDFGDRDNRYADPHHLGDRYRAAQAALMTSLVAEGQDALWDALIEQTPDAELPAVLDTYFAGLRPADAVDPVEEGREAFMGRYAAWAVRQAAGRPVLLVCGGWHAGAIRRHALAADGERPETPRPPEDARVGSYLVPYSYPRLDRFTGYAAGMPSPAYYEQLFSVGVEQAGLWAMQGIADALRKDGQRLSTADRVAWHTQAVLLARLRGHRHVLRADLLDAALSTVVKEALDRPPAWTENGAPRQGSDPLLLLMLRALSGDRVGALAPDTRHPPLLADVARNLAEIGIEPDRVGQRFVLDWHRHADRQRARVLHRLRILDLPGVRRLSGPEHTDARELVETFEIRAHPDWLGAQIEASIWGGTLDSAAASRLQARANAAPGDLAALSACISEAVFAGLLDLGGQLGAELARSVDASHALGDLGRAGLRLVRLYRFGDVFEMALHASLEPLCERLFQRLLWLLENVGGGERGEEVVLATRACRDLLRYGDGLALDACFADGVFRRCLADPRTPAALAGAALGYLLATARGEALTLPVAAHIRRHGLPEALGDFLAGLLTLAREQMADADDAFAAIDELVGDWPDDAFLRALPAMRGAFAWLPPRERERLARTILRLAGFSDTQAHAQALSWMRQRVRPTDQALALAHEQRVGQRLARWGLTGGNPAE